MKTQLYVCSLLVFALSACGGPTEGDLENITSDNAIIGGKETTKDNVLSKYVVLIHDAPTKNYCTGILIKKNVILTAAHCVPGSAATLSLAFGLRPLAGQYILRQAIRAIPHSEFKKQNANDRDDIALILINGEAPQGYEPAVLPDETFPFKAGLGFTGIGYGRTSGKTAVSKEDTQGSGTLRHVDLLVDSISKTEEQFYVNQKDHKGICNGDSGGPAMMRYMGKDFIVGIASATSWTMPNDIKKSERDEFMRNKDFCGEKSIYMNVKKYRPWIDRELKKLLN
ncbi:MAG: phosphotrypsin [Bdellovibrio sp. ArHS]|uniref:S1 family peptidase n=1 Tax=Bdellovibrio sp. ArHS TaxID=1569284 RepID=UPI000583BC20|nr:trypsin-like serine protease [Bdellovibrio sp. ArHS]KHD88717.1 MAG: phosphotrypsin [Bdellovibrio sp. ArHS]